MGEIDHVDKCDLHEIRSPFDPSKTHEEHYAELAKSLPKQMNPKEEIKQLFKEAEGSST